MATKKKKAPAKKAAKKTAAKKMKSTPKKRAPALGVPKGFTTLSPVLCVPNCKGALEFWTKAFGAKVTSVMPGPDGIIMHAEVRIGDGVMMVSDPVMGTPIIGALHHYSKNADAVWKRAVDAGCTVEMPIADQFWGDRYGVLRDPSGVRWSIGQQTEVVSPKEMMKRMAALPPPPG